MIAKRMLGIAAILSFWVVMLRADEPKPMPPVQADEAEKLREAIVKDMQTVEKKLQEADAGDGTRTIQKRILDNLDKLLDRAKNSPPPPKDEPKEKSQSQPMGSKSDAKSQAKSEPGGGSSTRRERREAQRRQQQQQQAKGGGKPQSGGAQKGQPQPNGKGDAAQRLPTSIAPRPDGKAGAIADVVKDIWGHLPETMRQEVDRYYRVQFMPRHRELVEQYYLRLAETEKRKKD